jgi:hypothetical protein
VNSWVKKKRKKRGKKTGEREKCEDPSVCAVYFGPDPR